MPTRAAWCSTRTTTCWRGTAASKWVSLNGDLRITEFTSIAFDNAHGILFGGTQDNGTIFQTSSSGNARLTWAGQFGGDGGVVTIDNASSDPIYYFSSQN